MEIQPVDGSIRLLFLAVGLIFALAGLMFIFRGKADENAARFEMFGLKFQSSSAGTLVFLIGVAFLLTPLFVPQKPDSAVGAAIGTEETPATPGGAALVLPAQANAEEVEPNNIIGEANQFQFGFGAKGRIDEDRNDRTDWYLIDTSGQRGKDLTLQVRSEWGGCQVTLYDSREEALERVYCDQNGGSRNFDFFNVDHDRMYLRVSFNGGSAASRANYEVFMREQ